ncbi:hypothetical protein Bca101_011478 [Brassica carinata]
MVSQRSFFTLFCVLAILITVSKGNNSRKLLTMPQYSHPVALPPPIARLQAVYYYKKSPPPPHPRHGKLHPPPPSKIQTMTVVVEELRNMKVADR